MLNNDFSQPIEPAFFTEKKPLEVLVTFSFLFIQLCCCITTLLSISLQLLKLIIKMTFYFMLAVNHCIFRCFFHAAVKCERASFMKRTA